ncbi:hypothetical protein [Streptomyces avermitilis]|uniref:hypothetical protein n=1 Tax=Streptomyces avermitilis TaxID=33903 RepID=UPI00339FBBEA
MDHMADLAGFGSPTTLRHHFARLTGTSLMPTAPLSTPSGPGSPRLERSKKSFLMVLVAR